MIKVDVNENAGILPWYSDNNNCLDKKIYFYYDETNNHRKFWLSEEDFNASIAEDFILGGVFHYNETTNADVCELKKRVNLQKNAKEIKFKHLAKKGSTFFECLTQKKVKIFLEWLMETDLYIHYSNINNFYYAFDDIVDTICEDEATMLAPMMKNELFLFAIKNYTLFFNFLKRHNYPNINDNDVYSFCDDLIQMIEGDCNGTIGLESLRQILKQARNKNELIF